jgi:splicing factor 3B subunit 2
LRNINLKIKFYKLIILKMLNDHNHKNYENSIDMLLKTRTQTNTLKKKEEYLKKQKEKKNQKKKEKRSKKKDDIEENVKLNKLNQDTNDLDNILKEENIEIEYIDEDPTTKNKYYDDFKNIFNYFVIPKKQERKDSLDEDEEEKDNIDGEKYNDEDEGMGERAIKEQTHLSKKKRKLLKRMKISELKALTRHPELVEPWDVTAQDPILLINLKTLRNTIPVPKHWSQKRKFLQNKRGIVKQPLPLPEFIENTGISKVRDTGAGDKRVLKLKVMDRMNPKMGKMDIDYQVLYDAFFKHQTKPGSLTKHGDIYYENKEYETKMRIYKPGRISEKLRVALGIPENSPPPWIINMQRYGPPPAYPNLKIPGVNAPILDPTADITPNLWTPPVSEDKPVPVFNYVKKKNEIEHWGDVRELDEDEYSDMDEDLSISDVGGDEKVEVEGIFSNMGMDDVSMVSAQKAIGDIDMTNSVPNPNAGINFKPMENFYSVLEEKKAEIKQNELYGSSFGYVIPESEKNVTEQNTTVPVDNKKEEPVQTKDKDNVKDQNKKEVSAKYKVKF